ncbi:hypothetical protein B0H11DRAFT_1873323 [Mycena galericulata]|nr:hypothetical protein B0H11DRAFT_1873323 [Mycena galericulata]
MEEGTRVATLWFSDGNLVLRAQNKLFRVPRSILAARSPVLREMVVFPQPKDANGETEIIDGSPVVRLPDTAANVEVFLQAIFDSSYFMPPPAPVELDDVLGILLLAHKYNIRYLYLRALQHLSDSIICDGLTPGSNPHPLQGLTMIQVVTEVGALWLLPALYQDVSYTGLFLQELIAHGADESIIRKCLAGSLQLSRATTIMYGLLMKQPLTCIDTQRCNAFRLRHLSRFILCVRQEVDLAPLGHFADFNEWGGIMANLCGQCCAHAENDRARFRQELWESLPGIFGLPPWPELQVLRNAAMGSSDRG